MGDSLWSPTTAAASCSGRARPADPRTWRRAGWSCSRTAAPIASGQISPPAGVATNPSYGQAIFGFGESQQTTLTASYQSGFVAKYAADGQLIWARLAPGAFHGYESVAELPDHRIVVAGTFGNYIGLPTSATFGPDELGQIVLSWLPGTTTANGMYTYLAWYNADGTVNDARTVGSAADAQVLGVAVAPDASVVLCGAFSTQMTFGPTDPTPVSYMHGAATG